MKIETIEMKRRVLAAFLLATVALSAAACASPAPAPAAAPAAQASDEKAEAAEEATAEAASELPDFSGMKAEIDVDGSIIDSALVQFEQMVADFNEKTGAQIELVENGNDHETIMKTRLVHNPLQRILSGSVR